MKFSKLLTLPLAVALTSTGLAACSSGSSSTTTSGGGSSLVVDTSFILTTADPARQFEPTGEIVGKALYQTLTTFNGNDVTKAVPGLATFSMSSDNKVMTLHIKPGQKFSDGSPITADDAVWSLQRVQAIAGNPSFLLAGITVHKVNDSTLTLTSKTPNPALPYILPNPALGILNENVVKQHGGSITSSDSAQQWLDAHSAGSGPYILQSFNVKSQVVLTANPDYTGTKPKYSKIVLMNTPGETQALNVQAGAAQVALDLSPDQTKTLDKSKVNLQTSPSADVVFLLLNQSPTIGGVTADPHFLAAVRDAVDTKTLVSLAGSGAVTPGGLIPSMFAGALPSSSGTSPNIQAAKSELSKSTYKGQQVTFAFANDLTVQGLSLQTLATSIQSQLKTAGINVRLAPAPVATELTNYRNGKEQMGLWYWGPDYPDAQDYLSFAPSATVGLRANWKTGMDPQVDQATTAAESATTENRAAAFRSWQQVMNASSPFIPLLQPAQNVATSKSVGNVQLNPVWTIDLGALS